MIFYGETNSPGTKIELRLQYSLLRCLPETRDISTTPSGRHTTSVETRTVATKGGWLTPDLGRNWNFFL